MKELAYVIGMGICIAGSAWFHRDGNKNAALWCGVGAVVFACFALD